MTKVIVNFALMFLLGSQAMAAEVVVIPMAGDDKIKVTRVTTNYLIISSTASCPSFGGGQCYYGSGTADCPDGMQVIGGGAFATSWGDLGHINKSRPSSDAKRWECASAYYASSTSVAQCYAICATIEESSTAAASKSFSLEENEPRP